MEEGGGGAGEGAGGCRGEEDEEGWRARRAELFHWSIYQGKWHINKHISPEVRGSNRDESAASSEPPPSPVTQTHT